MQVTLPIHRNAWARGDEIAIVSKYRQLTWRELKQTIARFAAVLASHDVEDGDRVAVLADNCDLHLAAFFAIPWTGGILVELNLRLNPTEIAEQIDHCRPKMVLYDAGREELLNDALLRSRIKPQILCMRGGHNNLDLLLAQHAPLQDHGRRGDDVASIFFTGGTSGRSKGVMLTHHNHSYNGLGMWAGLGQAHDIRYLHAPPMFHIADALFVHAVTLVGGLHVILPRFDAATVIETISTQAITDVYLVPTMIMSFLDALERVPRALPSLQRIYYGAMPMPESTMRRLMAALPQAGPIQLYGQTEAGPVLTMLLPKDHDLSGTTRHLRSAGTPIPGADIRIVAPDGQELPAGEVGEIVGRCGNVMAGYWEDEAQTQAALRDGWLHTGDGGYLDSDGFLYVVDRIKDMIISGGENIYSVEVERAITLHPAVAQCAVVGVPDPVWGERVHAVLVLQPGAELSHEELREYCRQHIAGYKLPRSTEYRDALPLSGPGKILKRVLRDEAAQRACASDAA
jgi:acyl-CoA synthetase (AMP-forming)/AMP-acid ligase II